MSSADEYVQLGVVAMNRPGFVLGYDLTPLLAKAPWRGQSLLVESMAGRVPKGRVRDEWQVLLQFNVFGVVDRDGLPHGDERVGVRENLRTLHDEHLTGGLVTLWHVFADGQTRSADVVVEDIALANADADHLGRVLRVTYDITVPSGLLAGV